MDRLCGVGSLQVVYHRFSDGVQVVRCVLDFFKSMSDVEQSYSQSIGRLVKSSSYTFHSNILMQWLGSDPFEEIGTVKRSWQQLGTELSLLADHHAHKAEGYLTPVRIHLQELLPRLEEMRLKLKNKVQQLKTSVEVTEKIHSKEKHKYNQLGEMCLKLRERLDEGEGQHISTTGAFKIKMTEHREAVLTRDLEQQEKTYKSAHEDLIKIYHKFNNDAEELYREVEATERERVKAIKESLQQFAKTLSNTAPAYLEGMSKVVISVDEIDASNDIISFVEAQASLIEKLTPPPFEKHQASIMFAPEPHTKQEVPGPQSRSETDFMLNGNRTPSVRSQSPHVFDPEGVKGHSAEVSSEESKKEEDKQTQPASLPPTSRQSKPSVRPKPPVTRHSESPVASSSGHVTNSSDHVTSSSSHKTNSADHVTRSSGHVTNSSDHVTISSSHKTNSTDHVTRSSGHKTNSTGHVTSSSSHKTNSTEHMTSSSCHVSQVINRMETSKESRPRKERKTVPARVQAQAPEVKLPSVSLLEQKSEPARPRTQTTPSPTSSPTMARRRAHTGNSQSRGDEDVGDMLDGLLRLALANDYYALLGVEQSVSLEELTRARREKSRQLHPDHFAGQPDKKLKAEEQLSRINQVYQDVLRNPDTRALYDRVCHFRQFYRRIPEQVKGLDKAKSKLEDHHRLIKKAQFPLSLLEELQTAVRLIELRMTKVPPG